MNSSNSKKPKTNAFANAFQQLALKTKDAIKEMEQKAQKAKQERDEKKRLKALQVRLFVCWSFCC